VADLAAALERTGADGWQPSPPAHLPLGAPGRRERVLVEAHRPTPLGGVLGVGAGWRSVRLLEPTPGPLVLPWPGRWILGAIGGDRHQPVVLRGEDGWCSFAPGEAVDLEVLAPLEVVAAPVEQLVAAEPSSERAGIRARLADRAGRREAVRSRAIELAEAVRR
jgi:hypothetical protein